MKPQTDLQGAPYPRPGHRPRGGDGVGGEGAPPLVGATMKEELPPLALPRQEYMERARKLWEDLGLPKLRPQSPWFGEPQGDWLPQWEAAAKRAVAGDYLENGRVSEKLQRKGLKPETKFRPEEQD